MMGEKHRKNEQQLLIRQFPDKESTESKRWDHQGSRALAWRAGRRARGCEVWYRLGSGFTGKHSNCHHDNEVRAESRRTSSHKSRTIFRSIKWELTIRIKSRIQLSIFTFTFHFHALEKEMATHSSVLAWRIPGTGEPRGLPSMGSHRVGHDWSDLAAVAAAQITAPPSKDDAKDVSGSSVDENPPACLCRGHHFDPWSGKIPRAAE